MQIASQLFEYTWSLWQKDVRTMLQGLSALSQAHTSTSSMEQQNDMLLTCERWLLCLKIVRQLIISGYASDVTSAAVAIASPLQFAILTCQ